jgi:predicted unusual protein kinase regulating ubiquinone biosynthesis (AarF/ABC1/UbiB family)
MTTDTDLARLYETDNEQWLEQTLYLLKTRRLGELDLEHLIEELEALSRRDKLTVESFLEQIMRHLLLYQYWIEQKDYNANHWQAEILGFRSQLNDYLTQNLRHHLLEQQARIYQKALRYVRQKTGYSIVFPETCPYALEQLCDPHWLSEG